MRLYTNKTYKKHTSECRSTSKHLFFLHEFKLVQESVSLVPRLSAERLDVSSHVSKRLRDAVGRLLLLSIHTILDHDAKICAECRHTLKMSCCFDMIRVASRTGHSMLREHEAEWKAIELRAHRVRQCVLHDHHVHQISHVTPVGKK